METYKITEKCIKYVTKIHNEISKSVGSNMLLPQFSPMFNERVGV